MNTNELKKFAKQARIRLLEDVRNRFLYWGLDKEGNINHKVEKTQGGYIFRDNVFNDVSVPAKWNNLVQTVNRHTAQDIIEEAAYTWFNRLIAIKILEMNGYDIPIISYSSEGASDPAILQNAKRGDLPNMPDQDRRQVNEYLSNSQDDEALNLLLIHYCRNHKLLNQVFGGIDDYTELLLPNNLLASGGIISLINSDEYTTNEDYTHVELIGWLYQFYITDKKDDVFASFNKNKKARAEDIPAATQIFTPKWIVKYLVENTVGRLWLDLHPDSPIRDTMKYLVEPENPQPNEPIIKDVTELTVLDPAVGSGHFLVVAFELLMQMYQEEGYSKRNAVRSIIENNLYGLDICNRATQLAHFAVLMTAAQYDPDVLRMGNIANIHCFPEANLIKREELKDFIGHDGYQFTAELSEACQLLNQGKNFGSAIKLELSDEARHQIYKRYNILLQKNRTDCLNTGESSSWNRLKPFLDIILLSSNQYTAVVTNPPYMGSGNMNPELVAYLKNNYTEYANDFMIVFMLVGQSMVVSDGYWSMINIHTWLTKKDFQGIREFLVNKQTVESLIHFGRGVFGSDFGTVAFSMKNEINDGEKLTISRRLFDSFVKVESPEIKENKFLKPNYKHYKVSQANFNKLPGCQFAYWLMPEVFKTIENSSIKNFGDAKQGIKTGDNSRFIRNWQEVNIYKTSLKLKDTKWYPVEKGGEFRKWYGNNINLLDWENNGYHIRNFRKPDGKLKSRPQNIQFFFKNGITWSTSASYKPSFRLSSNIFAFESSGSKFFLNDFNSELTPIIGFLNSIAGEFLLEVFSLGKGITEGAVKALPFIEIENNTRNKTLIKENINITKHDWDSREISWDFEKFYLLNKNASLSQAYQIWREQKTQDFFKLHANEEELNRIFIDIYRLQEELTPNVELKDITILQEELDRNALDELEPVFREQDKKTIELPIKKDIVIKQFLSYAIGCFMGRYRLDKPGLNIAHTDPSHEELASYFFNSHQFEIDDDGIFPTMGIYSPFSDDIVNRIKNFVYIIWGEDTLTENLNFINECLGKDLGKYLTTEFWKDHVKTYKKKPIYWQFASPKGAFKALVYMHRMNRFTVQKIRNNYLLKQIVYLESVITRIEPNESFLSSKEARHLDNLRKDLIECREYDLVLKDVADQQIEFDLDDGVTENYKLFAGVVTKI